MAVDLHIHSTFSDGTKKPAELVAMAKKSGLRTISITDHDTFEGVAEAVKAGLKYDVEIIPGIELSVVFNDTPLHLLGFFVDINNHDLKSTLKKIQDGRIQRNQRILEKLNGLGIEISMEDVLKKSSVGQAGRPHIAQVLVESKKARNIDDAFRRYLKKGAVAYSPRYILKAEKAINLIRNAGGAAVLAHPYTIHPTMTKVLSIIEELVQLGLDGIEVHYPLHNSKVRKKLLTICERYMLVITGGSDYHGDIRPNTSLCRENDIPASYDVVALLKQRIQSR